jgi:hypothetical protein
MFPFRWTALLWTLLVCAAVIVIVPSTQRLVRVSAGLYALVSIAAFLVPTPLGANITRFGMYAAAPVLLVTVPIRRLGFAVVVALIAFWQWSPALDAIVRAGKDPSTKQAYYAPLLSFIDAATDQPVRIEVVPTQRPELMTHLMGDNIDGVGRGRLGGRLPLRPGGGNLQHRSAHPAGVDARGIRADHPRLRHHWAGWRR